MNMSASDIVELWLARTAAAYPAHAQSFLATERDPFRNPIGHTLRNSLAILVRESLGAMNSNAIVAAIEGLMQLQAVQDLPPAKALGFIFELRGIARESGDSLPDDFVDRVDQLALLAFDRYMNFRERLFNLRLQELRLRLQRPSMEGSML